MIRFHSLELYFAKIYYIKMNLKFYEMPKSTYISAIKY